MIASSFRQQSTGSPGNNASYQFGMQDLELLGKFQARTFLAMTTDRNHRMYQNDAIKLARSHPSLMHAVLTLTLLHDRHLSATLNNNLSVTEAFHWDQSIASFSSKLSGPIQPSEQDALWATCTLLGIIAFYQTEAMTPEEAWSLNLNWLRISEEKKEMWKIIQPLGAESVFQPLGPEPMNSPPKVTAPGLEDLPPSFKFCDLDASSNTDSNPYHVAASSLAQSLNSDSMFSTSRTFDPSSATCAQSTSDCWSGRIPMRFCFWHIGTRRSANACQAICIFLERYRGHEMDIRELLQDILRLICGIVAPWSNKCAIDVQDSKCVRKNWETWSKSVIGFVKRLSSNKKAKDAMGRA